MDAGAADAFPDPEESLETTISAIGKLSDLSGTGIAGERSCIEGD